MCGSAIYANAANMCMQCIAGQVNISEEIVKEGLLQMCNQCGRYVLSRDLQLPGPAVDQV